MAQALTIKYFGAVIFAILVSAKIIPQVLLSYFVYGAVFSVTAWCGIAIVFAAHGTDHFIERRSTICAH